jgi:hypothetical protein
LLRRQDFAVLVSTAGRVLAHLVRRFAAGLRRRRGAGTTAPRIRFTAKKRYGRRLPEGRKAERPGELGQIDALFINIRPGKSIKHFTAYDLVAKWTIGRVSTEASATSAKSLLDKLLRQAPFSILTGFCVCRKTAAEIEVLKSAGGTVRRIILKSFVFLSQSELYPRLHPRRAG